VRFLGRGVGKIPVVARAFNHDFVGTDAVHQVEHAQALAVEFAFFGEGRKLVSDDAHVPTGAVGRSIRRTAPLRQFGRCLAFLSGAKRAKSATGLVGFGCEIIGSLAALNSDDDPTVDNGILA
jgi:hypothetical protein